VANSLVGVRSRIGSNCTIRDSVIIGSDKFETDAQRAENRNRHRPDLNIGDGSVIERAILDKDCRIGRGVRLVNRDNRLEADGPGGMFHIRDGIICIPRGAIIPEGTVV
jgi:glucose-1-phosphate adenylyltransferase